MGLFGRKKTPTVVLSEGIDAYKQKNYAKALKLFEKSAELGVAQAQYNCGAMYYKGQSTAVDPKKALYWQEKAAERGDADALVALGWMYYNGQGTKEDMKKGVRLWREASDMGSSEGNMCLNLHWDEDCI